MGNHGYPLHVRVCRLVFFGGGGGRGGGYLSGSSSPPVNFTLNACKKKKMDDSKK